MPILLPAIRDLVTGTGLDAIDNAYAALDRAKAHRATAARAVESAEREAKAAARAHQRDSVLQLVADKPLPSRPPDVRLELQADLDDAGPLVEGAVAHVARVLRDHGPALLTVVAQRRAKLGPDDPDVARLHAAVARSVLLQRTPICRGLFNNPRPWWPLPLAWGGHYLSFNMSSALRGEPHWIEFAWAQVAAGEPKGYKVTGPNRIALPDWVNPERPSPEEDKERMYELVWV